MLEADPPSAFLPPLPPPHCHSRGAPLDQEGLEGDEEPLVHGANLMVAEGLVVEGGGGRMLLEALRRRRGLGSRTPRPPLSFSQGKGQG